MAVSLPSDLIVDVMRNADPARLNVATARLQSLGDRQGSPGAFANVLGGISTMPAFDVPPAAVPALGGGMPDSPAGNAQAGAVPDALVDFERMVLRNLFESLLPSAGSGAFGSGPSAGIWRSLATDHLAGVYAGEGGIGIASALAADEQAGGLGQAQWPYFSTDKIEAFTG